MTGFKAQVDGVVIKRSEERWQPVAAGLKAQEILIIAQDLTDMQVNKSNVEVYVGHIQKGITESFTVDTFPEQDFKNMIKQDPKAPLNLQSIVIYTVLLSTPNTDLKQLHTVTLKTSVMNEYREKLLQMPE